MEQKRWNKWVKVGEVMGAGKPGENTYSFKVTPHSGENTFRVKQTDLTKRARFSEWRELHGRERSRSNVEPRKAEGRDHLQPAKHSLRSTTSMATS